MKLIGHVQRCYRLFLCSLITCCMGLVAAPGPLAYGQDVTRRPADDSQPADQQPEQEAATETTQDEDPQPVPGYGFQIIEQIDVTPVKSQDRTGTCWSFATASFLESEMIRLGHEPQNLSEMFVVRNIYRDKAFNYVHRNGKANFSEGALAHDYINAARRHGLVPEQVYSGLLPGQSQHNHSEMVGLLTAIVETMAKSRNPSDRWSRAFDKILDVYLGEVPEQFEYQGNSHTPQSFAASLDFDAKNYVSLTSFSHHPFHESFVLEIPDNFSNGSFYNVPIDELVETIDRAIEQGYSVAWDGDVSERGFDRSRGIAVLNKSGRPSDEPEEEKEITQQMRQTTFESHDTTDDHLMHLVGIARDKNGKKYYLIKNSWGEVGKYDGYLYMSEAYVRLKTIAIMVHKDIVHREMVRQESAPVEDASGDTAQQDPQEQLMD